jgi:hypothetical protein
MKSLEELSIRARIGLFFAIIIIVIALIYIVGSFTHAEGEEAEQIYQGVPINAHLLQLDKEALEVAYKEHLKLLFSVWLRDDITTVHRINNGLRNARRAYAHAAEQIEKRERANPK